MPCKKELDTSLTENMIAYEDNLVENSNENEVKSEMKIECISTLTKSEFVKQEQDPLQIDPNGFTENVENALDPKLIFG